MKADVAVDYRAQVQHRVTPISARCVYCRAGELETRGRSEGGCREFKRLRRVRRGCDCNRCPYSYSCSVYLAEGLKIRI